MACLRVRPKLDWLVCLPCGSQSFVYLDASTMYTEENWSPRIWHFKCYEWCGLSLLGFLLCLLLHLFFFFFWNPSRTVRLFSVCWIGWINNRTQFPRIPCGEAKPTRVFTMAASAKEAFDGSDESNSSEDEDLEKFKEAVWDGGGTKKTGRCFTCRSFAHDKPS